MFRMFPNLSFHIHVSFLCLINRGASLSTCGGVYFVFLRQEGFRQPPRKHFVIHGKSMENRSMENPWKIEWKIHGETMENSMENPWEIHGKSMDNKNGKKEMFPWYSMGPHGGPWGPMGPHEESWVPMGSHGSP